MEEGEDEETSIDMGWLVSYADLMTLLFATFVVLYGSVSQGTSKNVLGVAASVREAFVDVPDEIREDQKIGALKTGKFVFKDFFGETYKRPGVKQELYRQDPKVAMDRDKNLVEKMLDEIASPHGQMDLGLRRAMVVEPGEKGFTIKLVGAYFFDANEYHLHLEGRQRFLRLGQLLRVLEHPLLIEGHTDQQPARRPFDNFELGALRAATAARLLIRELGISPLRIETVSYGALRPIADNRIAAERQRNRRVEIKLVYQ